MIPSLASSYQPGTPDDVTAVADDVPTESQSVASEESSDDPQAAKAIRRTGKRVREGLRARADRIIRDLYRTRVHAVETRRVAHVLLAAPLRNPRDGLVRISRYWSLPDRAPAAAEATCTSAPPGDTEMEDEIERATGEHGVDAAKRRAGGALSQW